MPRTPEAKGHKSSKQLAAIDQLLIAGIRLGPAKKREAINRVLELVPEWTRGDCWQRIRDLRKTPELAELEKRLLGKAKKSRDAAATPRPAAAPWTPADDEWLLNLAGYEPVKRIAQRISRSVRAVRFRIAALGMSARITDGWSLRAFMATLRVRHSRVRQFIGSGILRVRDPRINTVSLAAFVEKNRVSLDPIAVERVTAVVSKGGEGYTWERAANLLGASLAQAQSLISAGQLRVLDTFVSDREFEDFCRKHGGEINVALIDRDTAKWLVSEYDVSPSAAQGGAVSRVQKHALVIRACHCGRKIAGNAYFRHSRICQTTPTTNLQDAR
jgi:hypothetical protein